MFKDVIGYEGLYKISEYGEILALSRIVKSSKSKSGYRKTSEIILKQRVDKYGYKCILLTDMNGCRKHHSIHRLVACAFIDNPQNLPSINHIDENKTNNHYSNLEWCSVKYNNLYKDRQIKINHKLRNTLTSRKIVQQFDLEGNLVNQFMSINETCRSLGVHKYPISLCCNGRKLLYRGFVWKFKEEGSTTIPSGSTLK